MHPVVIYLAAKVAAVGAWGLYRRHRKESVRKAVENERRRAGREEAIRRAQARQGAPAPLDRGEEGRDGLPPDDRPAHP